MSIKFYCRNCKADQEGFAPIEVALNIAGKRAFIAMQRKARPDEFSKAVTSKRGNDIKDYLDVMRTSINKAITEIARAGKPLTAIALKEYIKFGGFKLYTIGDMFTDHYALLGGKLESYYLVRDAFYAHINPSNDVNAITNAVIQGFVNKLYNTHKQSTAYGKVMKLKSTIQFALANHKLEVDPFMGVKYKRGKKQQEYLTETEVNTLGSMDFGDKLNVTRDLFIFQTGSGLAYADMAGLTPADIMEDGGTYYIQKNRQKTDVQFTAVLLPRAMEVLKRYNYCLPVASNAKLNANLKQIQTLSQIGKRLHTHLARKTYCTCLLNNGVRLDVVSKCAGHSTTRTTQEVYAFLQTQTIIKEVGNLMGA